MVVASGPSAAYADATADVEVVRLLGGLVDYAPSGMPDISQCRAEWSRAAAGPDAPAQWTYAGPVALADVLWWLDSRAEPAPTPPDRAADGYPLVTAYPVFGPAPDDHDAQNIGPLVREIAARAGTDGGGRTQRLRGTEWSEMVTATRDYVERRRLAADFGITSRIRPDGAWFAEQVAAEAGVLVLLGMWEQQGESWRRVGGHYVALAGAAADGSRIEVADPLLDSAGAGGAGRAAPADALRHSCREAPSAHDDVSAVSHDAYALFPPVGVPDAPSALAGYFTPATAHNAAAFADQNPAEHLADHAGAWQRTTPVMVVDAALALAPRRAAGSAPPQGSPTAPASPPPSATAEPGPTTGTATSTPDATSAPPTATLELPALPTLAAPATRSPWGGLKPVVPVGTVWLPIALRPRR